MITISKIMKGEIEGEGKYLVELFGLSTDEKPTTTLDPTKVENGNNGVIENGSHFIEIDTHNVYLYDEDNTTWINPDVEAEETDDQENVEQVGE